MEMSYFYHSFFLRPFWFMSWLFLLMVWEAVWKGIALWSAGRNNHKGWFVAIFIFNTVGILPIIYLLWFRCKCKCCEGKEEEKELLPVVREKTVKKRHKK